MIEKYIIKWLSSVILNISNNSDKNMFRKIEHTSIKLIEADAHHNFNDCCLIYIYM